MKAKTYPQNETTLLTLLLCQSIGTGSNRAAATPTESEIKRDNVVLH